MERYLVTVVSSITTSVPRPILAVPFEPSAPVTEFHKELFRRVARQNIPLRPDTHVCTLHLHSDAGAIIDCGDVLADIVTHADADKLFAVFTAKQIAPDANSKDRESVANPQSFVPSYRGASLAEIKSGEAISVRFISPQSARQKGGAHQTVKISVLSTVKQLHELAATQLGLPASFENQETISECNCGLARQISAGPSSTSSFVVVHQKSEVERLQLATADNAMLNAALQSRFGNSVLSFRKINLYGAEQDNQNPDAYKRLPVVAICSKARHIPEHARIQNLPDEEPWNHKTLDLHTSEMPISLASRDATLSQTGIPTLAVDGVVNIYAVYRTTSSSFPISKIGKGPIFRARPHWFPRVKQSDRGMAIFLSSLRVFCALLQRMKEDELRQDAILHLLDIWTGFPPAVRAFYILMNDKIPTVAESAAISHALFEVLDSFMPCSIIGTDHTRVFEGTRLLFGFILEKSLALKLPLAQGEDTVSVLPYLSSFRSFDLRDFITAEPVIHGVCTTSGLIERALFKALQDGGLLGNTHLQRDITCIESETDLTRVALLSGGWANDAIACSACSLALNYRYLDAGSLSSVMELFELTDLHHMAELCGRHGLSVHRPNQLVSAIAPCLTFDRNARLATYTGQQGCAAPGRSSGIFRPHHGEEIIDSAIVEQLIVPLLKQYEADGSAVFDALEGTAVRKLQTPDEVVVFCVDTSASMAQSSDFTELNDNEEVADPADLAQGMIESELYSRAPLEKMIEYLSSHESFGDMVAIVRSARASPDARNVRALEVLRHLRTALLTYAVQKRNEIKNQHASGRQLATLQKAFDETKLQIAGLQTHEDVLRDFLVVHASVSSTSSENWMWCSGQPISLGTASQLFPDLSSDITEVPQKYICPISYALLEDAVTASDGHIYSRSAISRWFQLRKSSPMTNVDLEDIRLTHDADISRAVNDWVNGTDLITNTDHALKRARPFTRSNDRMKITFASRVGSFMRYVPTSASLGTLYKLAFRGLKSKYLVLQLLLGDDPLHPSDDIATTWNVNNLTTLSIRLPDESQMSSFTDVRGSRSSNEMCLVKVYDGSEMAFGYLVKRHPPQTLGSITWKYLRHQYLLYGESEDNILQVWTDVTDDGDDMFKGCPRYSSENLSKYLNPGHCAGHLGSEDLYGKPRSTDFTELEGQPLVLKVRIHVPVRKDAIVTLTRLDVLKQMFEALINRLLAYDYRTHVGLVTFASSAKVSMPISHVLENFRRAIAGMDASGDTALWDALALARDQLNEYGTKYPNAKKRIIVISDGEDTNSQSITHQDACWQMRQDNIVVDSVCLGDRSNLDLRIFSYLLGSYRFQPSSLATSLAICEMEPFLSVSERPAIELPFPKERRRLGFRGLFKRAQRLAEPTTVTEDIFPVREPHGNLDDAVVQLTTQSSRVQNVAQLSSNGIPRLRISRLMTEIRQTAARGQHPKYDIYLSESDMSFWKIVMQGPDESMYSQGTFLLYLHADDGYPTFAPKARFVTRIKHPNVSFHGKICHSLFDRDWTSDTSMVTVLDCIYGILLQAELSDPVNTHNTLGYHHDVVDFADQVREFTRKYASKTREEFKRELLGE